MNKENFVELMKKRVQREVLANIGNKNERVTHYIPKHIQMIAEEIGLILSYEEAAIIAQEINIYIEEIEKMSRFSLLKNIVGLGDKSNGRKKR